MPKKYTVKEDQAVWERTTFEVEIPDGAKLPEGYDDWESLLLDQSSELYGLGGGEPHGQVPVEIVEGCTVMVERFAAEIIDEVNGRDRYINVEESQ